jgi:hypothetical protein
VKLFFLIVSLLDCFTLRVAMTETCAASPEKAQPEAIRQTTSFLFFSVYGMGSRNDDETSF